MFRKRATLPRRTARGRHSLTPGSNAMKAAEDPRSLPRDLSGPAAAVAVALVGAAVVAAALLLVGVHENKVGRWLPDLPGVSLQAAG